DCAMSRGLCDVHERLKGIKDVRGRSSGDEVLRTLALRMSDLLHDDEFVARLGGDEFAAIHHAHSGEALNGFLARIET
ncbi:diguanylate cyclase domain-containing protein, partial [Escherichia coli]|uniref:diguanylate cyclase domain-containing protein n=1 Tax=Escherichia coli TaxID=562 RepID=UPI001EDBE0E9